ncbi:unnamed protein product [Diatraea saccharalis]|uniref:DUF4806 domain-containing protein n=1 Tax=Diatraea saccharalis TaxID=40085 RepID=A0A9N9RFZ3_9NEOP|nr:unnamed protein product [Diatraea saccharalis]CAG9795939.1 unnamed protein product [Diatraea saccharalis]
MYEVVLNNLIVSKKSVNHLSYIGGNKPPAIVKRILEKVFTNNLAVNCNWTGKKLKDFPKGSSYSKDNKSLTKMPTKTTRHTAVFLIKGKDTGPN